MVTTLSRRIALLSVAIFPVIFSEWVNSEPVNAIPQNPHFFCFAQGSYGEVVNLNHLCQQTPPLATKSPSTTKTVAKAKDAQPQSQKKLIEIKSEARLKVDFSELNYEQGVLMGSLRNKTKTPLNRASITYKVYKRINNSTWKLVDTDTANMVDMTIPAGRTSSFKAVTRLDGDKIVITNLQ